MKIGIIVGCLSLCALGAYAVPLGLPPVPVPKDNPLTPQKIELGDMLYHDPRFSADGKVSCATCHAREKAFTDHLRVSKGFSDEKGTRVGTRNAPTVINAAYNETQFWDGRVSSLEEQSKLPPINPVEGGLHSWDDLIEMIKKDEFYVKKFKEVFGVKKDEITIDHFAKAIASFERTVISGDSPFDRYYFGGQEDALTEAQKRGFELFMGKGRCVSCHTISQSHALFTDNDFHNLGVGFKALQGKTEEVAEAFIEAVQKKKKKGVSDGNIAVDEVLLEDKELSELGRFAITQEVDDMGAFKTPTLRNVAKTAPYMHDGSLKTLVEVIEWYNFGGKLNPDDPDTPFLDGGIRPLGLTTDEVLDLVAFMKALTSPEFENVKDKQ